MPYNSILSRSDVEALIPEDVSRDIIKNVPQASVVMQLGRKLPNMARNQRRMPVLSSLVTAYFVNGDTGLKQTSEEAWSNKYLNAEELAVIVPIPEAVLDDTDYDIWGEIRPEIEAAFGLAFDQAVFYGANAPASWPDDLLTAATAAGNVVSAAAYTDLYEAIMGESAGGTDGLLMTLEADGYMATAHVASIPMRGRLRNVRDTNGNPIFKSSIQDATRYELDGAPCHFPKSGAVLDASSWLISGEWSQLVYSMRQDITYKVLDQAVIQDGAGNIIYNLAQQDMVALRAVMRLAWQVPNPINRVQETEANRFPFAILTA